MGACATTTKTKSHDSKDNNKAEKTVKLADFDVDVVLFSSNDNLDQCHTRGNRPEDCSSLKRLISALELYSKFNISDNMQGQGMFNHFVNDIYYQFLDDYIHFNNIHSHQLQQINERLPQCDISSCGYTTRHYQPADTNSIHNRNTKDPTMHFYKKTMDGLHFYLYHCFDAGLRIKQTNVVSDEVKGVDCFDSAFSRMDKIIVDRQHITAPFNRFSANNSKFTIKTNEQKTDGDDTTYFDELCLHLKNMHVDEVDIALLKHFAIYEEYDSDCIEYDSEFVGNLANQFKNNLCSDEIDEFIKMTQVSSSSFSIGFRFYYWSYYEKLKEIPEHWQYTWNDIDHSGYKISELYVKPTFSSFKEEIANYKHIDMNQYEDYVYVKAKCYQNSQMVKKTKAVHLHFTPQYYDISKEEPLKIDHIISLILYTDWTDLSTDFSATFRKKEKFETIKSIKKRNSMYYWFSRRLRECVEMYGQCRIGDGRFRNDKLTGCFYCGMSIVMNIPSFNIRLYSPTSTSKQLAVATRFSGPNGIVIQIDNPLTEQYMRCRGFDCSWISRFKEEDERLFFGGYHRMKIDSVIVRKTKQNFATFMYSLYYLDSMVTAGTEMGTLEVSKQDILIIRNLINHALKRQTTKTFDDYIYSTFTSFVQSKKQIALNLPELHDSNEKIRNLLMYPMMQRTKVETFEKGFFGQKYVVYEWKKIKKGDVKNLFRSELLQLFKNAKTVIMQTSQEMGFREACYSLSLTTLLSIIKLGSLDKVIVKTTATDDNWIAEFKGDEHIKHIFGQNGCSISVKMVKHKYVVDEYWLVIENKP
eukprot:235673_1